MIIFGLIKFTERQNRRHDRHMKPARLLQLFFGSFGLNSLLFIMIEYCGPVLEAPVHELAVRIHGIYAPPEGLQQFLISDLLRIKDHLHGFIMAGFAA